jgi:hypothetical protein
LAIVFFLCTRIRDPAPQAAASALPIYSGADKMAQKPANKALATRAQGDDKCVPARQA